MRLRMTLLGLAVATFAVGAQEQPRFRAGANLVRVDAYISQDGAALTDLTPDEFVVFEDDKPQEIENVELIEARAPGPQSERLDPTNVRDMRQQASDAARVFTLFFDRLHVSLAGSYHASKPIVDTLDRLIGADDLVGIMTPEMSPGSITFSSRTTSIGRMVTDAWHWGSKDRIIEDTPQERAILQCYPGHQDIAVEMIARRRERQVLDSLDALVSHLDGMRPERKFVMVFTEGWPLYKQSDTLARTLDGTAPGPDRVGVDPTTGRVTSNVPIQAGREGSQSYEACERERVMLAFIDHEVEFRELLQRANRANVSFYPIDARGLIVFDQPQSVNVPPSVDNAWLRDRHDDLRMMAAQTDGQVVLDSTNDISGAMQKIFTDVGSYYLLSYYSTNTKLDGRFRRIRVEVKREDTDVRARPGYLAPTEAEARAAGVVPQRPANSRSAPALSPSIAGALDRIAPGRGKLPVRIQAAGARSSIRAVVELDAATLKLPEWIAGGTLELVIAPDRGTNPSTPTMTVAVEPGQWSIPVTTSDASLTPGRYSVRAEVTPKAGRVSVKVTTFVTVPDDAAEIGTGALALRRGPRTGLAYVPTADPRFRRTERLRLEVPLMGEGYSGSGRLLTRNGRPMPLIATYTTRVDDESGQLLGVAELALAPLAAGEYVFEVSLEKGGKTQSVAFGFRLVP